MIETGKLAQKQLEDLVSQFQENFKKYDVNQEIVSAGPGFDGYWIIKKQTK